MVALILLYLSIGWFQPDGVPLQILPTPVDDWVPFSLLWLPIYAFMLPMSWAPACTFADKRDIRRWVVSVVTMYVPAVPLWYYWPVTVARADVPVDGYLSYCLWVLRTCDPPVNCMPSMHVAVATMAGLLIRRVDPVVGRRILLVMPLIWYSTMALDQHWFLDGLAGMVLAFVVEQATHRLMPRPPAAHVYLDRRYHWTWMGAFAAVMSGLGVYWFIWL
jgi:membrane-associated phospholipid phosphatase